MILRSCKCNVCGLIIYPDFQRDVYQKKECPNGCAESKAYFARWIKERQTEIPDEIVLDFIQKSQAEAERSEQ